MKSFSLNKTLRVNVFKSYFIDNAEFLTLRFLGGKICRGQIWRKLSLIVNPFCLSHKISSHKQYREQITCDLSEMLCQIKQHLFSSPSIYISTWSDVGIFNCNLFGNKMNQFFFPGNIQSGLTRSEGY